MELMKVVGTAAEANSLLEELGVPIKDRARYILRMGSGDLAVKIRDAHKYVHILCAACGDSESQLAKAQDLRRSLEELFCGADAYALDYENRMAKQRLRLAPHNRVNTPPGGGETKDRYIARLTNRGHTHQEIQNAVTRFFGEIEDADGFPDYWGCEPSNLGSAHG